MWNTTSSHGTGRIFYLIYRHGLILYGYGLIYFFSIEYVVVGTISWTIENASGQTSVLGWFRLLS